MNPIDLNLEPSILAVSGYWGTMGQYVRDTMGQYVRDTMGLWEIGTVCEGYNGTGED